MFIVDSHCYAGTSWFEPVELILHQMTLNGVAKALLVQYGGNNDNQYLLECVQRFPGRFGVVVAVDPSDPEVSSILHGLAQSPGVVGVRLGPGDRSPGPDPLALWRQAASLGLPVSCFAIDGRRIESGPSGRPPVQSGSWSRQNKPHMWLRPAKLGRPRPL